MHNLAVNPARVRLNARVAAWEKKGVVVSVFPADHIR